MAKLKPFVLPEIITIDGVNHGSFRGALHAEFQRKQYDLINAADRTKLGISDALMKAWDELIKLEDDSLLQRTKIVMATSPASLVL